MSQNNPEGQIPPQAPVEPEADHLPHKPADDREEVYYQGSPLLRADLGRMAIYSLISLVLIVLPIVLWIKGVDLPWWLGLVLIIAGIVVVGIPVIITRNTRYRITNYRIDFERGILSKAIDTLELWHVEDIKFHQSLMNRLLGVGHIDIISHDDTTPILALRGIPSPRPVFESLKQRIIAVKRQRGVIKMDLGA